MTAPLREQLVNDAVTTLNGGIDASQTSIIVTAGSVFPATGNFRIKIEDELMLVTARSTNTLTVVRAYEGTTGATHADSSAVTAVLTAGSIDRFGKDNDGLWGYSSGLPVGKLVATNGITPLTVSDFTWVNQGTATASDQNGTIAIRALPSATSNDMKILKRAAPSPPYSLVSAVQFLKYRESVEHCGILFRKNSDGKMHTFSIGLDGNGPLMPAVYDFTNATTYGGTTRLSRQVSFFVGRYWWQKIEDDNTNLKFYVSFDGVEWIQVLSFSRTAFMTGGPDEIGIFVDNTNTSLYDMVARFHHWSTF